MGFLQPSFKKAIVEELLNNVSSNSSYYYAFAANPVAYNGATPTNTQDDYRAQFEYDWYMLFGKKLSVGDFAPLVQNNLWTANTVYRRYDNTDTELYSNNMYYVISPPNYDGGTYNIYKCIDVPANGAPSTYKPSLIQYSSFQTDDGYVWKYLSSVPYRIYKKFYNLKYAPIVANTILSLYGNAYCGVEKVMITNSGIGYASYHDGTILSANNTVLQIQNDANIESGYYTNSAIFLYNVGSTTSQILTISDYVSNSVGKWIYVETEANTTNILPQATQYKISPRVVFQTDGGRQPLAYSVVNAAASNSISEIVMLDIGSDISWANVHLASLTGSGANMYAIVPPPGGHGSDIMSEIQIKALGVNFIFANNEANVIPDNIVFNKIGILKDPYGLYANGTKSNTAFTNSVFNQVLKADLADGVNFSVGDTVTGNTTNSVGTVAYCNAASKIVYLTGDKSFLNGEYIFSSDNTLYTTIDLETPGTTKGSIYAKDIKPLYIQNINNVNRSNTQTESFKLIIEI